MRLAQGGARFAATLILLPLLGMTAGIEDLPQRAATPAASPAPAAPFLWPNFAAVFSQATPLLHEGCNTISYASAPDLGNRLIGRVMNGDPVTRGQTAACPGGAGAPANYDENESLTLVALNSWPSDAEELQAPIVLTAGQCRKATTLSLCYGQDGNLTVDVRQQAVGSPAASPSAGASTCIGCIAKFQTDGNLVLYRPVPASNSYVAYWASGTAGHPGARLELSQAVPYVLIATPQHALLFPHYLTYQYKVLDTSQPVSIENGRQQIISAYDATLAPFNGQYWVAFECALASGVTASCVGPLVQSGARLSVDLTRTSVVATGQCATALSVCVAASVPKLINYQGSLYLYWDDLAFDNRAQPRNDWAFAPAADVQQYFISVNARAARLALAPASGRLYVLGRTSAIVENDATASVQVMPNIDLAQVLVVGTQVLATGSLTQGPASLSNTCAMPLNSVANCYRLAFAQASSPLGPFSLIPSEAGGLAAINGSDGLPNQPALYNRFVYLQDSGQTMLMGGVYFNVTSPSPHLAYSLVSQDYLWPSPLLVPVCNPITQPYPQWMAYSGGCIRQHGTPPGR